MNALTVIEHPAVTKQRLRQRLTLTINKLIRALDEIDGDPDLEDGGDDEPSLSFTGSINQDEAIRLEPMGGLHFIDLEDACEDEGGQHGDREPEDGQ